MGLGDAGAHCGDAGLVGYVHPHKGGVGRLRSCLALSLVEIGHNDCRAPLGAEQRGGLADAGCDTSSPSARALTIALRCVS